jgi:D-alanyl-D-alanine carboxypeptidase/D-alanyl-D-alanine-endopeptidase (penicillin-binding protein 4)
MKNWIFPALVFPILVSSIPLQAVSGDAVDQVIKASHIPRDHFGLWIQGPEKKYALNDDKMMVPASLSKIPTAVAALSELGVEFQYETKIYYTGAIDGDTLKGDIYLEGGGDPSVVSETYWLMINELKRSGIRKILGQLYVDDSKYDQVRFSESRQSRRVDRAYDAPVGALSFNWNSVNVFIRPGAKDGDTAQVFADPENEYITLKNFCKTGGSTNITVERKTVGTKDIIEVHGKIGRGEKEQVFYKSVSYPEYWAGYNFKAFLNNQGISYLGTVEKKAVPPTATILVTYKSKPFQEIVADMAKFSNNYVAEMLTKALAQDRPASLANGVERIQKWLQKMGWKSGQFIFENPSGFSNDNKFRPRDLGELLAKVHRDFSLSPEFTVALPISGIDGTLKKRLKDMRGQVRAKTGYLNGIIGLAGYVEKKGEIYTFVFIYNGPEKHDAKVRDVFDQILRKF